MKTEHPTKTDTVAAAGHTWLEQHFLPLLLALCAGLALGHDRDADGHRQRVRQAQEAAAMSQRQAEQATLIARRYHELCSPLLELPLAQSPEVIPTAAAAATVWTTWQP